MNNTDNGWAKHWPDYLKAAFRGFTQPLESCTEALATFTTANCNIVLVPFKQHPAYHSALTHYPKGKCILAYTGFVSWSEPHYLLSDNAPSRMSEGQEGGGERGVGTQSWPLVLKRTMYVTKMTTTTTTTTRDERDMTNTAVPPLLWR